MIAGMEETSITIRLNGQPRRLTSDSNVALLLAELGFAGQSVLVEVNGAAVFPRDFARTELIDGDVVEVIRIVAGG